MIKKIKKKEEEEEDMNNKSNVSIVVAEFASPIIFQEWFCSTVFRYLTILDWVRLKRVSYIFYPYI